MILVVAFLGGLAGVFALLVLARQPATQRRLLRSAIEIVAAFGAVSAATFLIADAVTGFRQGLVTHIDRVFALVPAFIVLGISALFASRRLSPRQFHILCGSCLLPFPVCPILGALDQQGAVAGNSNVSDGPGQFVALMLTPIITLGLVGWIALTCVVVFTLQRRSGRANVEGDTSASSTAREGTGN